MLCGPCPQKNTNVKTKVSQTNDTSLHSQYYYKAPDPLEALSVARSSGAWQVV